LENVFNILVTFFFLNKKGYNKDLSSGHLVLRISHFELNRLFIMGKNNFELIRPRQRGWQQKRLIVFCLDYFDRDRLLNFRLEIN